MSHAGIRPALRVYSRVKTRWTPFWPAPYMAFRDRDRSDGVAEAFA